MLKDKLPNEDLSASAIVPVTDNSDSIIVANPTDNDHNTATFDSPGYDEDGFDIDRYNRDGFDRNNYDRQGYGRDGYNKEGYNRDGFNAAGYGY